MRELGVMKAAIEGRLPEELILLGKLLVQDNDHFLQDVPRETLTVSSVDAAHRCVPALPLRGLRPPPQPPLSRPGHSRNRSWSRCTLTYVTPVTLDSTFRRTSTLLGGALAGTVIGLAVDIYITGNKRR